MHLCLENHLKNLVALWQGQYKDLDEGRENYCIPNHVWERIGQETALAGNMIPSTFGHCTPNIWSRKHIFTAKDWFYCPKYYNHFMKFNSILKQTIQYSLKEQDIEELEQDVIQYVKEYERYVCFAFVSFFVKTTHPIIAFITSSQLTAFPPAPSLYMHLSISQMTFETTVHPVTIGPSSWNSGAVHYYWQSSHKKSLSPVLHCGSTKLHRCLRPSINST